MNLVKVVRQAKKMMKKDVLARGGGILTAHRLNMIEAGTGRPPKVEEKVAIAYALDVPEKGLFLEG